MMILLWVSPSFAALSACIAIRNLISQEPTGIPCSLPTNQVLIHVHQEC
jgi:hypothetical protein